QWEEYNEQVRRCRSQIRVRVEEPGDVCDVGVQNGSGCTFVFCKVTSSNKRAVGGGIQNVATGGGLGARRRRKAAAAPRGRRSKHPDRRRTGQSFGAGTLVAGDSVPPST